MRNFGAVSLTVLALLVGTSVQADTSSTTEYTRHNTSCTSYQYWNGQACIRCLNEYCTCSTPLGCTSMTCPSGMALDSSNATNKQCVSCPTGCSTCNKDSGVGNFECTLCSSGFQLISKIANQNIRQDLCEVVNWPFQVYKTYSQQYGGNGTCALMDSDTTFCSQCADGYFLNEVLTCEACVSGCISCTSRGTCAQCATGTFWNPLANVGLMASQLQRGNIQIYMNDTITISGNYQFGSGACQSCTDRNAISCESNGTNATKCQNGYFLQVNAGSQNLCTACPIECGNCTSSTQCTSCITGYYLESGSCKACYGNTLQNGRACLSCTNGKNTSCDVCRTNYVKLGTECINCATTIPGCATCNQVNNKTSCITCADGYYKNVVDGVATCTSCITADPAAALCYKDDYGTQSAAIITQCTYPFWLVPVAESTTPKKTCKNNQASACLEMKDNGGNCTTCPSASMIVYNGKCTTCAIQIPGCQKCTITGNDLKCAACSSGVTATYNSQNANYALDTAANSCVACNQNCATCTADSKCQSCRETFVLSNGACVKCNVNNCKTCSDTQSTCSTCLDGYFSYSSNNVVYCLPCPLGCSQCGTSGQTCTSCLTGFYLKNGGCNQGASYCSVYNTDGTCSTCQYGFRQMNGRCYPCIGFENGFVCGKTAGNSC